MRLSLRSWLLAYSLLFFVLPGDPAYAQRQPVNCSTSTACNASTGPTNTNTGDPAWKAFGKLNANDTQLYSMFGATGLIKGNGAVPNALTTATLADFPAMGNQSVYCNGSGTSSAPVACVLSGNLKATPTGLTTSQLPTVKTGAYTIQSTDAGGLLIAGNAGATAWTLAAATTSGFTSGFSFDVENEGAGTLTITPTTSTINNTTSLAVPQNTGCTITSDGTNYHASACTAIGGGGGGGGSSAFASLTSGTNTTGAFVVGSGASLTFSGSGSVTASALSALTGLPNVANQSLLCNGTGGLAPPSACSLGANLAANSSGVIGFTQTQNPQTGTSYAFQASDAGKLVSFSNASAVAVTLSSANTTGFTSGWSVDVENDGAGTVTITPTTSTINGASTLTIAQNRGCTITSNGTNYKVSACTAIVSGGGSGTVTSVAATVPTGFTISGSPVTSSGTLAIGFSGVVVGGTKFTTTPTGCTPSATAGGGTAGSITLAAGPCTSIVITMNGATGLTAGTGWHCSVNDETATNAGTYIPEWGQKSSTQTTATIPIPPAVGATDKITFACTGF